MYKNLRKFLFIVAGIAIIAIISLSYIVNRYMLSEFKKEYGIIKDEQVDYYFSETFKDLQDLVTSHAVWTDTIEAIEVADYDWLYDNATGYIVDDESLNIDYLFISDENGAVWEAYGEMDDLSIIETELYTNVLEENQTFSGAVWYNGAPLILVASPLYDNEMNNPTGCYIIGRLIDGSEMTQLKKLLSSKYVISMDFTTDQNEMENHSDSIIRTNYLLDENKGIYLQVVFSIGYFTNIYNSSMIITGSIIIIVATLAVSVLTLNIKQLSSGLNKVIESVKQISSGDYHVKLEPINSKVMPEVNELIESVNTMSDDIESHITDLRAHSKYIDQQYIDMIGLLVNTVEMNDSYTYHHSVSVSDYALLIGKAIGFKDLEDLELAAKLHDIGKISISTEVLNKPGRLTPEEFKLIQTHSENGFKLLDNIDRFDVAKYGVLYHHEKYNGTGYPEGLKENEIPLIAQIISVADIYDAITSDRAYRKAMSYQEALKVIRDEKGKSLNPMLVDVFCEELAKLEYLKKEA